MGGTAQAVDVHTELLVALDTLDRARSCGAALSRGASVTPVVDACLGVMRALPGDGQGAAALPEDSQILSEAAAFFSFESGAQLGQHFFDADLWDDVLNALAEVVVEHDAALARSKASEVAEAVAASARFVLLPEGRRQEALDSLTAAVAHEEFVAARKEAIAAARRPRAAMESEAEAYDSARQRRRKKDFVAVPPGADDDESIIVSLYRCTVQQLGSSHLQPLGFPATKLGLRSLVAAARATGSQRAVAALGRVWHASNEPGPLIVTRHVSAADARTRTLVLVFSSLGWNGVVRAEWGATLRGAGDDRIVVAHALDTLQSWFMTDPTSGEYDDGQWWDKRLERLCAPFGRVCILGESMGATAALRYAHHATGAVVALVPQIDVRDFGSSYAGRADFSDARKVRLRDAILDACRETEAEVVLHVGQDPPDLRQLSYLPQGVDGLRVVQHGFEGHALGAGLKAQGLLRKVVLGDLLGHTYCLPASGCSSASGRGGEP